ncbi:C2 family cysteine protease [Promicromonospora sp. NPDC060204]|uniref:C2 family cysteine protease n=1 Tax=Promicromonospora sp. NPDC060204 TaxID=3347071 RepID=UPI0036619B56
MSEMYGADISALRTLGNTMVQQSDVLETAVGQITQAVSETAWSGPDHEGFLEEWHVTHSGALRAVALGLAEVGRRVIANADAQERTSETYDGAVGGVAGPGPGRGPEGTDQSSSGGQGDKDKAAGDLGKLEDAGNVPLDDKAIDASQIEQGSLADCWFLASAGAIAERDPDWIREHIKRNDDGTYTVTFYEDGEPVQVTVDSQVYENAAGDPSGDPSWISIYEKAAVQHLGGQYDDIEYDSASKALEMMTGKDTSSESLDPVLPWDDPPSLESIRDRLGNGEPVVAASPDGGGWFGDPPPDKEVVNNHVYVVDGVSADGKTITLVNPWGPNGGTGSDGNTKPGTITMSADEFYDNFDSVTYGGSMK